MEFKAPGVEIDVDVDDGYRYLYKLHKLVSLLCERGTKCRALGDTWPLDQHYSVKRGVQIVVPPHPQKEQHCAVTTN